MGTDRPGEFPSPTQKMWFDVNVNVNVNFNVNINVNVNVKGNKCLEGVWGQVALGSSPGEPLPPTNIRHSDVNMRRMMMLMMIMVMMMTMIMVMTALMMKA